MYGYIELHKTERTKLKTNVDELWTDFVDMFINKLYWVYIKLFSIWNDGKKSKDSQSTPQAGRDRFCVEGGRFDFQSTCHYLASNCTIVQFTIQQHMKDCPKYDKKIRVPPIGPYFRKIHPLSSCLSELCKCSVFEAWTFQRGFQLKTQNIYIDKNERKLNMNMDISYIFAIARTKVWSFSDKCMSRLSMYNKLPRNKNVIDYFEILLQVKCEVILKKNFTGCERRNMFCQIYVHR